MKEVKKIPKSHREKLVASTGVDNEDELVSIVNDFLKSVGGCTWGEIILFFRNVKETAVLEQARRSIRDQAAGEYDWLAGKRTPSRGRKRPTERKSTRGL